MQEICLDRKEFKSIREVGGVYVDKTKHIYDIFSRGLYYFLARPRRFGKSLLCTTLQALFQANRELFKGLWIDSLDWKWEKYPVLYFDMSNASSKTGTAATARRGIINMLNANAKELGITDLKEDRPFLMLEQLIEKAQEATGQKIVIIIDEYDKPLLDVIDTPSQHKEIHQEISDFYSQLKPAEKKLKFVFITGVFKFTQTSIFSGLNNLNDITFDSAAAEIVGYTDKEIRTFFTEHLAALALVYKKSVEEMMVTLQEQYNGYRFGVNIATADLSEGVYCSFALNYVFAKQQLLQKWFESASPRSLIKKLAEHRFQEIDPLKLNMKLSVLTKSCTPDEIESIHKSSSEAVIGNEIDELPEDQSNKRIISLSMLYYAGYLTIHKFAKDKIFFGFPNVAVASDFVEFLLPLVFQKSVDRINEIMDLIHDVFCDQRLDDLKELLNDALAPVSYHTLKKPDERSRSAVPQENFYQFGFYYLFTGSRVHAVTEDTGIRGRIDITVELPNVVYLFEFKMDDSAASAIAQIKDREYARKFKHTGKKVYAVGVSISSEKRVVQELEWVCL